MALKEENWTAQGQPWAPSEKRPQ